MSDARTADDVKTEQVAVLQRHVDHLLAQLYHQIELIQQHKQRAEQLEREMASIKDTPRALDDARRRFALLREEIAGRKEVELDLRRRLDEMEAEHLRKEKHIRRLEGMLRTIWARPHNRIGRLVKRMLGLAREPDEDTSPPAKDRRRDG
ncbi:MAG: hypothetical protein JNL94_12200 [Planctomycetes bacterium]|nr:hypothetical protein [Planctomycetota bacterium]